MLFWSCRISTIIQNLTLLQLFRSGPVTHTPGKPRYNARPDRHIEKLDQETGHHNNGSYVMSEIIFEVTEGEVDSGYSASALGYGCRR